MHCSGTQFNAAPIADTLYSTTAEPCDWQALADENFTAMAEYRPAVAGLTSTTSMKYTCVGHYTTKQHSVKKLRALMSISIAIYPPLAKLSPPAAFVAEIHKKLARCA